jgi:hypothetical protein
MEQRSPSHSRAALVRGALLALVGASLAACGPRQPAEPLEIPGPAPAAAGACHEPMVGANVRITNAVEESLGPVIAWNGTSFDLAWRDMRGRHPAIYTVRVDRAGAKLSEEARIPGESTAKEPSLTCDAAQGHLVFLEQDRARSVRLAPEPRDPVTVDDEGSSPAAGALGAVAWVKKGNLLFRSDPRQAFLELDRRSTEPVFSRLAQGGITDVAVAWNGELFAVVWSELAGGSRRIMLQRANPRGERIGPAIQVSVAGGVNRQPVPVWSGEDWGVLWTNEVPAPGKEEPRYRVFFSRLPAAAGGPRATHDLKLISASPRAALASTGREFGVAWLENLDPVGSVVFFQRLGREGELLGIPLKVSDEAPLNCGRPDLAWAGDGFGVTWHDDREPAGSEIFFSFLSCGDEPPPEEPPPPEADAGPAEAAAGEDEEEDRPLPELYTEDGEQPPG